MVTCYIYYECRAMNTYKRNRNEKPNYNHHKKKKTLFILLSTFYVLHFRHVITAFQTETAATDT